MCSLRKFFEYNPITGRYGALRRGIKQLPTHTHTGEELSWLGRLTYGWLWTFDPEIARIHDEQDKREGR